MADKVSNVICSQIKEAIADERSAPFEYKKLLENMKHDKVITKSEQTLIEKIMEDEQNHEKFFMVLAVVKGCEISQKAKAKKEYYELPLARRVSLAKQMVSKW